MSKPVPVTDAERQKKERSEALRRAIDSARPRPKKN
jgi:hypothetical protein